MNPPGASPTLRRRAYRLLLIALLLYLGVCLTYALYQRKLIYFPPHYTVQAVDRAAEQAGLERWYDRSGQAIGLKRRAPRQPALGQILVLYGNGGCAFRCAHYIDEIQSVAPLDGFILEYPGYGDRAGKPTERNFFAAADEALGLLRTNQPIYVLGESLGTGVAAYLAGKHPDAVSGVVLLSPYNRLAVIGQYRFPWLPVSLLLADRFVSEEHLSHYQGPVGIVVDGRDDIVPEQFGRKLFESYGGPKRLWIYPEGGHIALPKPHAQFWNEVIAFWRTGH